MIITMLTDFGYKDPYVAEMKGVILQICRHAKIIDITHDILPQNVEQGAFLLYTIVPYFPKRTIHLAVVDPGVGTERKGLIIDCKDYILVGPDNGLLIPAAMRKADFEVYEIANREYFLEKVTNTFHGRDIFAPVAAHIANGVDITKIGKKTEEYVKLSLEEEIYTDDKIEGKVVHIDRFGNLITNIKEETLLKRAKYGETLKVRIDGDSMNIPFLKSYGYTDIGNILITIGGNGFVEISINGESAFEKLRKGIGSKITITF